MELLEGETLGRRLEREGRLGIIDTARLLGQSARALHRAHQLGIVHRDFKPDNIVIGFDEEGRDYVKVLDFGVAKLVGDLDPSPKPNEADLASSAPPATFTKTGAMLGTPYYMAPEQIRSPATVDLRADIWAFGVVAFECLTGSPPFAGDTLLELFQKIERGTRPPVGNVEPTAPAGFDEWFDTACAPDPQKRFPDVNAAYKGLLVALDCGKIDLEPSMKLGRSISAPGIGQVVVTNIADANAVTIDAPVKKGVEPRHNRGQRKGSSIRVPAVVPVPSEPAALARTIADDRGATTLRNGGGERLDEAARPPGQGASRSRALLAAISLLLVAGLAAWRFGSTPAPSPAPAEAPIASPPVSPAPSVAMVVSAAPARIVAPAPSALQPPAASASGATAKTPASRPHPRPPPLALVSQGSSAPAAASAPIAAPPTLPPPASATAQADPGSYR
jgi:serine/threonine-protein kinase